MIIQVFFPRVSICTLTAVERRREMKPALSMASRAHISLSLMNHPNSQTSKKLTKKEGKGKGKGRGKRKGKWKREREGEGKGKGKGKVMKETFFCWISVQNCSTEVPNEH